MKLLALVTFKYSLVSDQLCSSWVFLANQSFSILLPPAWSESQS